MNTRIAEQTTSLGSPSATLKPIYSVNKLHAALMPFCERSIAAKGAILRFHKKDVRMCFLLIQGSIALHRRGDGIVINAESAPYILGISNQLATNQHLYIRALETIEIARISLEQFNQIISQNALWEDLTKLLIYTTSRVYEHCTKISQMSAYDIVRSQLQELMQETKAIRDNTTAANYIKNRTYLSRSGIMRILSELRTGGYITMQRGILQEISHLPLKY